MADDRSESEKYLGITYWQALALMLVGLKLAGSIDWHWGYILIPHYMLIIALLIPPTIRAFVKTVLESPK